MSGYFNFTVIIEWCAFIASLIILNRQTGTWRLFIVLMLLVICTETAGWYMYAKMGIKANCMPFNILMLISNVFLIWFFSRAPLLHHVKNKLIACASMIIIFWLINLVFFQGTRVYNNHTESFADIMLSIICCYFLFCMITDTEQGDLLKFDYFWLAAGVLLYSSGSALLYQFSNALGNYYKRTHINVGNYINYALNFILYSTLIIAFIWKRKTTR